MAFIASSAKAHASWTNCAAVFLAVWVLYAGDRLLDARTLEENSYAPQLEERHHFHARHRDKFLFGIVAAAVGLILALHQMDTFILHRYSLLAVLLGAWLLLVHAMPPAASARRLPKELAVGLFFSAAVFIPALMRQPRHPIELVPYAILFAAICMLNCFFIYAWEHPILHATKGLQLEDRSKRWGSAAMTHWTTRWAVRHLVPLAVGTIALAGLSAAVFPIPNISLACAFSAAALLVLHRLRARMSILHLRAASDLALLSPLLLIWMRNVP